MTAGLSRGLNVARTLLLLAVAAGVGLASRPLVADLAVPACTAYVHPDPRGATVGAAGITRWSDPATTIHWHGLVHTPGVLAARVAITGTVPPRLALTVGGTTRPGTAAPADSGATTVEFGEFSVAEAGPVTLVLRLEEPPPAAFRVDRLVVDGPAAADAHFNLDERRNAASVHLVYPIDRDADVRAFTAEVTAVEAPVHSFFMACGWHRGYLGMQVNSATERRIIFSVWDSGAEAVDRRRVADEDRVRLVAKGDGVFAGDFDNEGTGGHSHLKVAWRTGVPQRFVVTATPRGGNRAIFAGFWFDPDDRRWRLISAWDAPHEAGRLRGLHGFSENFVGDTGDRLRKSLHGEQWFRTADGAWHEITKATFSHDPTGKKNRLDRFMGVEDGRFFLAHGGFGRGFTPFGAAFERAATGRPPEDLDLPPLP